MSRTYGIQTRHVVGIHWSPMISGSFAGLVALLRKETCRHSMGLRHPVRHVACLIRHVSACRFSPRRASGPTPWRAVAPGLKPLCLPRTQLQVFPRQRATNYRALLRERAYKDKASCVSSPPCMRVPGILGKPTG